MLGCRGAVRTHRVMSVRASVVASMMYVYAYVALFFYVLNTPPPVFVVLCLLLQYLESARITWNEHSPSR